MADNKKISFKVLFVILGLSAAVAFYLYSRAQYVNKHGQYAIAKRTGITPAGKNGPSTQYMYVYNGQSYATGVMDRGQGARYIFIKILTDDPGRNSIQADAVAECLQHDSLLGRVWKEVPECE